MGERLKAAIQRWRQRRRRRRRENPGHDVEVAVRAKKLDLNKETLNIRRGGDRFRG